MGELLNKVSDEILFSADMAQVLFQSAPDAILLVDDTGTIRMANGQAELLSGYHHSELRGSAVEMLLPPELEKTHRQHREEFFDDPRLRPMGIGYALLLVRKDKRKLPVDINLSPVVTARGVFVIATIRRQSAAGRPAHTGGHTSAGP